jgi:hypothetical protein
MTDEEEILYSFAKASVPRWLFARARSEEEMGALIKIFDRARQQIVYWASTTFIGMANGSIGGQPDWLGQHARERGTERQDGETDDALRARLRNREDAVTVPALLLLIADMLAAEALTVDGYGIVELRKDRAFFNTNVPATGTGIDPDDYFVQTVDSTTLYVASAPWAPWMLGQTLTISGSYASDNDGDYVITGFDGSTGLRYFNINGGPEPFPGTWSIGTGRKVAYLSRGYRMSSDGRAAGIVAITPYGVSEALRLAIHEALRLRKAAGVPHITERRINP